MFTGGMYGHGTHSLRFGLLGLGDFGTMIMARGVCCRKMRCEIRDAGWNGAEGVTVTQQESRCGYSLADHLLASRLTPALRCLIFGGDISSR